MQPMREPASAPLAPQPQPSLPTSPTSQPVVTLSFDAQWTQRASGSIRGGDTVRVVYDARRLPGADEIKAWVTFDGKLREQAIYVNRAGGPSSCEFVVPKGTRSFAIWFEGTSRRAGEIDEAGRTSPPLITTLWDSDFERNYRFDVAG
jgi:hypothetical protein